MLLKISVFGDSGVGKTNFCSAITENIINYDSISTKNVEFTIKTLQINNVNYAVQIFDTPGDKTPNEMPNICFQKIHGMILLYDISNKKTFQSLSKWIKELQEKIYNSSIPVIIIGNNQDKKRKVNFNKGNNFAITNGCSYEEVSTIESMNTVFTNFLTKIIENFSNSNNWNLTINKVNTVFSNEPNFVFQIILVGDSNVGKTSFFKQITRNIFKSNSKPTVGIDFGTRTFEIDGKVITVQILDSSGNSRYLSNIRTYFKGINGAMIFYDITNKDSFQSIPKWINQIRENTENENMAFLVVGNKNDMENDRKINYQEGRDMTIDNEWYFDEISSINIANVENIMLKMLKILVNNISCPTINNELKAKNIELKEKLNEKLESIKQIKAKYQQIIHNLFNNDINKTFLCQYDKRKRLFKACKEENFEKVNHLTQKGVIIDDFIFKLNENEKTADLIGINNESLRMRIPNTVTYKSQNYLITSISDYAFFKCNNTETVYISSNLKVIGSHAFDHSCVKYIAIPSSILELKKGWREKAKYLNKIKIYDQDEKNVIWYKGTFLLRKSNPNIDKYDILFGLTDDEKDITIPSFVKIIEPYTLLKTSISQLTIPNDSELQCIEKNAFVNSTINKLNIPSNFTNFKPGWNKKTKFKEINIIPNNEENITIYKRCFLLGKTNLKSSRFDILLGAINDLRNETLSPKVRMIMPYSLTECKCINKNIFQSNLELQVIEKKAFAFSDVQELFIPPNVTQIGKKAFYSSNVKFINFPPKLELIYPSTFFNCENLLSLNIQSNYIKFEEGWSSEITNLTDITIDANNKYLQYYENKILLSKSNPKSDIYDLLIFANRKIKEIIIPSSVQHIQSYAFSNCEQLKTVEFTNDSQLKTIGMYAFSNSGIENLSIPSCINDIEIGTCFYNTQLMNIKIVQCKEKNITYYKDKFLLGKKNIKSNVFDTITFVRRDINEATIPPFIKYIGQLSFGYCTKCTNVNFPANSNLKTIANSAFRRSGIQAISIPSSVTSIEKGAFYECGELKKVIFPSDSKLKSINKYMFSRNPIESIAIPPEVATICDYSFDACKNLKVIEITDYSMPLSKFFIIFEYSPDALLMIRTKPDDFCLSRKFRKYHFFD